MKKVMLYLYVTVILFVCSGCSGQNKTPRESEILMDYISECTDTSYANFSKVEIIRQQHIEQEKTFSADIKLTGKDDYADYICEATVLYNYYDDQGWMLDEVDSQPVETKCYNSRTLEEVEEDIKKNYTSYIPGGLWVDNISVEPQLDQNLEIVTLDCEIAEKHLDTKHEGMRILFEYKNGNWIIENIQKSPINFYVNLKGTGWNTDDFNNRKIKITDISDDSREITFECNGNKYIGTLKSEYSERTFSEGGGSAVYNLDKDLYMGSVWGVDRYADNFTIYDLSNENEDVWLCFDDSDSGWIWIAGYHLTTTTPVSGVRVY